MQPLPLFYVFFAHVNRVFPVSTGTEGQAPFIHYSCRTCRHDCPRETTHVVLSAQVLNRISLMPTDYELPPFKFFRARSACVNAVDFLAKANARDSNQLIVDLSSWKQAVRASENSQDVFRIHSV